ncbi:MAG: hypothetical protein ABWZ76_06510 [Acidimicrobiales bacterium]
MAGTCIPIETLTVVDRYGRQAEGTLTRTEWSEHGADPEVEVVRYHRDLLGQAA